MQVPPEMAFRGVQPTDDLKALILEGIEKLEAVHPRLITCRTMVDDVTPERRSGNNYRVRLEISIPHKTVIVDQSHPDGAEHHDVAQTIREAFSVARERLKKVKAVQRGDVKTHDLPPHGRIVRLLSEDGGVRYGFLESRDGRQIYFSEDALVDLDYDELEVGDEVRYTSAEGGDGPRASTVARLRPDAVGRTQQRSIPLPSEPRTPLVEGAEPGPPAG